MIDRDIVYYLQTITPLTTLLGGASKVFPIQATVGTLMPWLVVESAGGIREKINATDIEETSTIRITLDCSTAQIGTGRSAIEAAKAALEQYRGQFSVAQDVYIRCGAIRGWAGYSAGTYRWQFDAMVRYVEQFTRPTPYTPST